jgi:hypothetical protein
MSLTSEDLEYIENRLKKVGIESKSEVDGVELSAPFYLPAQNVVLWPFSPLAYLKNAKAVKPLVKAQIDLITEAGVNVKSPGLGYFKKLSDEELLKDLTS